MSNTGLAERLTAVRRRIDEACDRVGRSGDEVALLAVSKRQPIELLREACDLGQVDLGENRIQDLAERAERLAELPVRWHQIGPVQSNKVRALLQVQGLALLHSVDRAKLCDKIAQVHEDLGLNEPLACLIQVDATGDENKHGVLPVGLPALFEHAQRLPEAIRIDGLMAMGPLEADPAPVFEQVRELHVRLRESSGLPLPVLSMGMSGDLEAAIAAGSTMVRVGTDVFGPRTQ